MASAAEELVLRITGDSEGGQRALGDLVGKAEGAIATFQKLVTGGIGPAGIEAGVLAGMAVTLGTAMYELGQHATEVGAELERVSLTTQIPVGALSDLKFAITATGGSLEQLNTVMFMFEQRLENSTDKVSAGLDMIGLSLGQITGMSRDQQLLAISDAFRSSGDEVNKAAAAMDIFGRQGRTMLPQLMMDLSGLDKTSRELGYTWSEVDAKAAHEFEIASKTMATEIESTWVSLGRQIAPVTNEVALIGESTLLGLTQIAAGTLRVGDSLMNLIGFSKDWALEAQTAAAKQDTINRAWDLGADGGISYGDAIKYIKDAYRDMAPEVDQAQLAAQAFIDKLSESAKKGIEMAAAQERLREGLAQMGIVMNDDTDIGERLRKETDEQAASAKKYAEQLKVVADFFSYQMVGVGEAEKGLTERLAERDKVLEQLNRRNADYFERLTQTVPAQKDWWETLQKSDEVLVPLMTHTFALKGSFADLGSGTVILTQLVKDYRDGIDETSLSSQLLQDTFASIPKMLETAFTGGGGGIGAAKAIGTHFGTDLGKGLQETLYEQMGSSETGDNILTNAFGDKIGGAITNAIPIIGSFIGPAISGLISLIQGIGGPDKDELAARGTFDKQFKSVDDMISSMSAEGAKLGINGEVLRQALQKVLDATHVSASAETAALADLNKLMGDAKQEAADVSTGVTAITTAAHALGTSLPDDLKASIEALANMQGITDDEKASLLALTADVKPNFEALTKTASEYGISLEALGPSFQQADIDATSKKIYDDFTDLKNAGGDVGGILLGMSDEFSGLVNKSRASGSAIADNLKPYIQNLIDSGKLLDENGDKITDISTITFKASPLNTSLDGLSLSIQHLTDLLAGKGGVTDALGKIGQAAGGIPENPFKDWQVPDINMPALPDFGGAQAEGGSYHVTRPTLFLAGEKPGGEDVSFSGVGRSFRGMGSSTVVNNIDASGSIFRDRAAMSELADEISQHIVEKQFLFQRQERV